MVFHTTQFPTSCGTEFRRTSPLVGRHWQSRLLSARCGRELHQWKLSRGPDRVRLKTTTSLASGQVDWRTGLGFYLAVDPKPMFPCQPAATRPAAWREFSSGPCGVPYRSNGSRREKPPWLHRSSRAPRHRPPGSTSRWGLAEGPLGPAKSLPSRASPCPPLTSRIRVGRSSIRRSTGAEADSLPGD